MSQSSATTTYAALLQATPTLVCQPRYNVAPQGDIIVAKQAPLGERLVVTMRWGLVPAWSKGPNTKYTMINARAETIQEKPAYRAPFKKSRCLIPADGFFEWTVENGKQPYYIKRINNTPLFLGGICDHWLGERDGENCSIESCAIIVTTANSFMHTIHERMPVILKPDQYSAWLDNTNNNTDELLAMLQSYPADDLEMYRVSRKVNNPRNEGATLIQRIE